MNKFFTLLSFSLVWVITSGQNADLVIVDRYETAADSLNQLADYKNAIVLTKKALNLLQAQPQVPYDKLAATYRSLGYYYRKWGKYPESLKYQNKAVSVAESKLDSNHPELANAYNGLGAYYYALQDYHTSLDYFEKALNIGLVNDSNKLGDYYNNIGICQQGLGNSADALITYSKALAYNLNENGLFHTASADNHENIGTLLYSLNDYEKALLHLDTAEQILDSIIEQNSLYFATVYNNKGVVYNAKGDSRNAFKYFSRCLKIYERYGYTNHPEIANIYSNLGLLLQEKGDLDAALSYFNRALEIRQSNFGEINPKVARTRLYIGNCYLEKKHFDQAIVELNKSLSIFQKIRDVSPVEISDVRNGLGAYFEKMNNLDEALLQYQKALGAFSDNLNSLDPNIASTYARIGKVHLAKNEFDKAEEYFLKALKIRLNVFGNNHPDVADCFRLLALTCKLDIDCQNENIENALKSINYDFDEDVDFFDKSSSSIYLLNILRTWSNCLKAQYDNSKDISFLNKADEINDRSISLINHIKTTLEQPGSRLALLDNYYLVYEGAIFVKHQLYQLAGDKIYLNEAFQIAEQSNAILLVESIQSVEAETFAGIPDSLIKKESQLKRSLSFEEKKLFEERLKKTSTDFGTVEKINNRIFELQNQQRKLLLEIKKNYKDYFRLKYEQKEIDIEKIQKQLLRPDQTLLSYFVGENNLFVFVISRNQFELVLIDKDFPLEIWVEEFRNSIYSYNPADQKSAYLNQKLANLGHELYQLVFEPIKQYVNTESLLIIPGGVLGYLPFDALLASPTDTYNDFDNFDYLIKKFNISYCYSTTLLDDMTSGHHRKSPFVAFAPTYYGDTLNVNRSDDPWRAVLGQLRFNIKEARSIHEIMGGQLYIDSLATEEMFLQKATKAGIIHLATHGKSDDRNGEYSYLAFYQTEDSIENELLFVKNLYDMKIPASMVVLSACETGIGELQRGEGIISLARGFSFAGAASIVTTLWSIDDNASANIMIDFYKNLKTSQPKDVALRNSKLSYIKNNKGSNRTHPLFWAAFVPVGNMEPIENGANWWPYLLSACLLGLIIFYKKRRKVKSPINH